VYVEIKGRDIERHVVDVLTKANAVARAPVHSFDHRAVLRAHALEPQLVTGILEVSYLLRPDDALRAADARDYWQEWSMIDETLVERIHEAGGRVIAWTVNDPEQARRLAMMSVDALCTDVPNVIGPAIAAVT
jgi:glycerophosphoryl diester phosphodiesterase